MNIPADALVETVERYNELAHAGKDADFSKVSSRLFPIENPPYYACKFGNAGMLVMFGGLECNHDLQVTKDGTNDPIPGLYVAGADNGTLMSAPYCDYEGYSLMCAYCGGRLAGQYAVETIDA